MYLKRLFGCGSRVRFDTLYFKLERCLLNFRRPCNDFEQLEMSRVELGETEMTCLVLILARAWDSNLISHNDEDEIRYEIMDIMRCRRATKPLMAKFIVVNSILHVEMAITCEDVMYSSETAGNRNEDRSSHLEALSHSPSKSKSKRTIKVSPKSFAFQWTQSLWSCHLRILWPHCRRSS